jgi:hypothetical protein
MLTIDRKLHQTLLLVHKSEQCLMIVRKLSPSYVTLSLVGDSFRILRGEGGVIQRLYPNLRVRTNDNLVVNWGS